MSIETLAHFALRYALLYNHQFLHSDVKVLQSEMSVRILYFHDRVKLKHLLKCFYLNTDAASNLLKTFF